MRTLEIGALLPVFAGLKDTAGKMRSVEDFRDARILVIVFSCNHCPYVQAYEDRMIAFQEAYAGRGVQLVAINANDARNYPEDNYAAMVKRAAMKKFNFPYLRDEDQRVAEAFGATHTPEFFVFASSLPGEAMALQYHGKMDDKYDDPSGVKRPYLREAVEAILAGRPVAEPETHSIGCTIKWRA